MPDGMNSDAKTQMYLTLVTKDHVLLLNGIVSPTMEDNAVQKFLIETAATLKVSSTPIDMRELQESIRKGNPG